LSDNRFEELVDTHGRDVLNVALRITGDAELAKDVYQEVFLAIWRRWPPRQEPSSWGAYLYRVTVRKAIEMARRSRAVVASVDGTDRASPRCEPDQGLRFDELQQRLTRSLAKLPERQADVFVLSRIEGLDHEAIAEVLGCSRNTVRVSLHRAVKQLAREMSEDIE
jgi:RNA polymerase sigma factor (sigma-70 family)